MCLKETLVNFSNSKVYPIVSVLACFTIESTDITDSVTSILDSTSVFVVRYSRRYSFLFSTHRYDQVVQGWKGISDRIGPFQSSRLQKG